MARRFQRSTFSVAPDTSPTRIANSINAALGNISRGLESDIRELEQEEAQSEREAKQIEQIGLGDEVNDLVAANTDEDGNLNEQAILDTIKNPPQRLSEVNAARFDASLQSVLTNNEFRRNEIRTQEDVFTATSLATSLTPSLIEGVDALFADLKPSDDPSAVDAMATAEEHLQEAISQGFVKSEAAEVAFLRSATAIVNRQKLKNAGVHSQERFNAAFDGGLVMVKGVAEDPNATGARLSNVLRNARLGFDAVNMTKPEQKRAHAAMMGVALQTAVNEKNPVILSKLESVNQNSPASVQMDAGELNSLISNAKRAIKDQERTEWSTLVELRMANIQSAEDVAELQGMVEGGRPLYDKNDPIQEQIFENRQQQIDSATTVWQDEKFSGLSKNFQQELGVTGGWTTEENALEETNKAREMFSNGAITETQLQTFENDVETAVQSGREMDANNLFFNEAEAAAASNGTVPAVPTSIGPQEIAGRFFQVQGVATDTGDLDDSGNPILETSNYASTFADFYQIYGSRVPKAMIDDLQIDFGSSAEQISLFRDTVEAVGRKSGGAAFLESQFTDDLSLATIWMAASNTLKDDEFETLVREITPSQLDLGMAALLGDGAENLGAVESMLEMGDAYSLRQFKGAWLSSYVKSMKNETDLGIALAAASSSADRVTSAGVVPIDFGADIQNAPRVLTVDGVNYDIAALAEPDDDVFKLQIQAGRLALPQEQFLDLGFGNLGTASLNGMVIKWDQAQLEDGKLRVPVRLEREATSFFGFFPAPAESVDLFNITIPKDEEELVSVTRGARESMQRSFDVRIDTFIEEQIRRDPSLKSLTKAELRERFVVTDEDIFR